jgi:membrane associated rhomboid family serine protease
MIFRFLWEFPLTTNFSILLVLIYFLVNLTLPHPVIMKHFYSYPRELNPLNWFLSSLFHSSVSHLTSNILFLFFLGRVVEERLGTTKWLVFYFMAGILSMMVDSMVRGFILGEKFIPAVGASGAISGLAAVAMVYSPFSYKILNFRFPFPVFLVAWMMVYSDFVRLFSSDRVAHWAHLAGFFSVFVTSYLLSEKDREKIKTNFGLNFIFFIMTVILLFFLENR